MRLRLPSDQVAALRGALRKARTNEIGGQIFGEQLAPSDFRATQITFQHRPGTFARFVVDLVQAARMRRGFSTARLTAMNGSTISASGTAILVSRCGQAVWTWQRCAGYQAAAVGRSLLGGRHADRLLGVDEELPAEGRLRRSPGFGP